MDRSDSQPRNSISKQPRAFTLIELLVVIGILGILMALLFPVFFRMRYQAKLVMCASNLRQISAGVLMYAADNNKFYPNHFSSYGNKPGVIYSPGGYDMRPELSRYMDINKLFNDPLAEPVDYVKSTSATETTYELFAGYQYIVGNEKGMFKVGEGFTFQGQTFHVLACDEESINLSGAAIPGIGTGGWNYNSHPDRPGTIGCMVLQDKVDPNYVPADMGVFTFSRYERGNTSHRNVVDMNFAFDDGSVRCLTDLSELDARLVPVPTFSSLGLWPTCPCYLPKP